MGKMVENNQARQILDEAVIAGHFLRMIESAQRLPRETTPWETPARDMWKLISEEEKRFTEEPSSPEALAGEFFQMAEDSKKQMKTTNDRELQAGQFWKMIEKEMNLGKEVFVADSFGNVFRKIKGYQIMASNKDNLAEAKMVADFFKMVEIEQGKEEASSEIFAGDFWKMIKNSKVVTVKKTKEAMVGTFGRWSNSPRTCKGRGIRCDACRHRRERRRRRQRRQPAVPSSASRLRKGRSPA